MAGRRLPGGESRVRLIEAAARIINEQGYAALSAKTLAESVGLKRQIVHYYFRTMDDLLLAVVRYYGDMGLDRFSHAAKSGDPLRLVWEMQTDASATTFAFMAMASHKPVIRAELRRYLEAFRKLQVEAVSGYMASRGIDAGLSPAAAVIILQSVSQALSAEVAMGTELCHDEVRAVVDGWLRRLSEDLDRR